MQQADLDEGLFQFDFSLPVYENLIVSLVNVCHFLRSTSNYALYRSYIFAFCKHLDAVCSCICIVLEKFGHRKIVLQEIYVILAKYAPHVSKNRKILGSDPG